MITGTCTGCRCTKPYLEEIPNPLHRGDLFCRECRAKGRRRPNDLHEIRVMLMIAAACAYFTWWTWGFFLH
jgi:hypothetical protein